MQTLLRMTNYRPSRKPVGSWYRLVCTRVIHVSFLVRNGLSAAGIDFGVFVPEELKAAGERPSRKRKTQFSIGTGNDDAPNGQDTSEDGAEDQDQKQDGAEGGDDEPSEGADEERGSA